jgi:succinylarginine dihydrolase
MSDLPHSLEVNFDGLVGPTHNYAGLSPGNLASQENRGAASNPRAAALEGLAKMKLLMDLGLDQAVLPPHPRPDIAALRRLGFTGSEAQVLGDAACTEPALLAMASSASPMWAANAATVSPSADTGDGRLHLTPANLASNAHRALETPVTAALLRAIFPNTELFAHHDPLPAGLHFADEGAANHTRLCANADGAEDAGAGAGDESRVSGLASHVSGSAVRGASDNPGVELFVYDRAGHGGSTTRHPTRHTAEASAAIARLHRLSPARVVFAQQNPAAIDAGVFHNDVIAVGHRDLLLCHELAWVDQPRVLAELRGRFVETCGQPLRIIEVPAARLPLADAVSTYLFNSQLLTLPEGGMGILCAAECAEHPRTADLLTEWAAPGGHFKWVRYVNVRQSMRNGGGPACLRLRIVLTPQHRRRAHPGVFLTPALYDQLTTWVRQRYRDQLTFADLADPHLLRESRQALDELSALLHLGSIYDFQR